MIKKKIANIPFGPFITVLAGAMISGKPNATKMGSQYFDIKDRVCSLFQTYRSISTHEPK